MEVVSTTVNTKMVSKSAPVVPVSKFPPTIHTNALVSYALTLHDAPEPADFPLLWF